ncbi:DUF222 domain-containing protein [Rathayibacter sp. CAU 1779]
MFDESACSEDDWDPPTDDGFSIVEDWAEHAAVMAGASTPTAVSAERVMDAALSDVVASQTMANLLAARQLFAIRDAVQLARENPHLYVRRASVRNDNHAGSSVDARDFAERAVAFDLAHRLHVSETAVRAWAHQGDVLASSLPLLCNRFLAGAISAQHVREAVDASVGLPDNAAVVEFDRKLSEIAERMRAGEFSRRARLLRERLCADTLQARHDEARKQRRVGAEADQDGMAWLNIYLPVIDAARIEARLASPARRMKTCAEESRTLDQLQADVAVA